MFTLLILLSLTGSGRLERDLQFIGVWREINTSGMILVLLPSGQYSFCTDRVTRIYFTNGSEHEQIEHACISGYYQVWEHSLELCSEGDLDNIVRDAIGYHGPLDLTFLQLQPGYMQVNVGWHRWNFVQLTAG